MLEPVIWLAPAANAELGNNEVHLWKADLNQNSDIVRRMWLLLNEEEQNRAKRYVFEQDRIQFTLYRGILRQLLGRYLRRSAEDIEFAVGPKGKPTVRGNSEFRFSLSHSDGLVLYALSMNRELGVDLEREGAEFSGLDIVENWFSTREKAEFLALPSNLQKLAFYVGWTRKEAYLKARGEGLHMKLEDFDVSMNPGQPAVLRSEDSARWELRSFCPAPDFVAALVVERAKCELCYWEWRFDPGV